MRYILVGKNGIPTHGKIISLQDKILVLGIFACTRENRDGKHRTSEKMGMGETTFDVPICTQADFWKRLESAKLGDIFTLQEIANHVRSARRGVDECLYIGKGKVTASQPFVFACSNVPFCSLPPSHNWSRGTPFLLTSFLLTHNPPSRAVDMCVESQICARICGNGTAKTGRDKKSWSYNFRSSRATVHCLHKFHSLVLYPVIVSDQDNLCLWYCSMDFGIMHSPH